MTTFTRFYYSLLKRAKNQAPSPSLRDIYSGFDSIGESLVDFEYTMQKISDDQWQCSAKRQDRGQFTETQNFAWNVQNASEVGFPKFFLAFLELFLELLLLRHVL